LITQEVNGHRHNGQTSEANISIKFNTWLLCVCDTIFKAICLTSSVILVLHIKTTEFCKWVLFLSLGGWDMKKFLFCWAPWKS
jgi:hypothetical protein